MVVHAYEVGITSEMNIAGRNKDRTSLVITNAHTTAILFVRDAKGVATTNGMPIYPRGSANLSVLLGDDPTLDWWAISDTADTIVRVYEGYAPK